MEDPTVFLSPPPLNNNSKKRLFAGSSGSSSSSFVEPDLIEIPPPPSWKPKPLKQKSVFDREVIDLDSEDADDVVIIEEKIAPNAKGKKPMFNYAAGKKGTLNDAGPFVLGHEFKKGTLSSSVTFIDDDFDFGGMDIGETVYDQECALLQAHFDNVDIPSGVEATVPWWPSSVESEKQPVTVSGSSTMKNTQNSSSVDAFGVDKFHKWSSNKSKNAMKRAIHKAKLYSSGHTVKKNSFVQTTGMILPELEVPMGYVANDLPFEANPFGSGFYFQNAFQGIAASANPFESHVTGTTSTSTFLPAYLVGSSIHDHSIRLDVGISAQISPPTSQGEGDSSENSIVKKLELFKKFDTLEDHSGHLYHSKASCSQSKSWVSKIADEWRMLERDLPGTIFVRVFEARMDLLRAIIVGADGTPYHDGLFLFDVNFPSAYPNVPPLVKYHARGLRINPNLYNCGKVCLSLLGTWSGSPVESWRPGKSNMLQVLLSIQGLILNAEPYYNEPGYENMKHSHHGKQQSKHYSENTFLLSLKTMLYTMRDPPKYFEDLVFGHFYTHAHDILAACSAYLHGVEVGNFDKSKSPTDQVKGTVCSELLKMNLPTYIKSLVEAFTKIGVKDCDKYLVPIDQSANQPTRGSLRLSRKNTFLSPMVPGHFV